MGLPFDAHVYPKVVEDAHLLVVHKAVENGVLVCLLGKKVGDGLYDFVSPLLGELDALLDVDLATAEGDVLVEPAHADDTVKLVLEGVERLGPTDRAQVAVLGARVADEVGHFALQVGQAGLVARAVADARDG